MRSESEMYSLILTFAERDERIRAVYLNGSRADPNAPEDKYQDFDIVYVVREFEAFKADWSWLDVFGERLIMQTPEIMRYPDGSGHFNWMMLFTDGNRIDLTLIPIERPDLISHASDTVTLLDKDGILPDYPPNSDRDYRVKAPDKLFYFSACNNFWWCMQNVAKGVARDELPYAMGMFNRVVRSELNDMLGWYIAMDHDFDISVGKMGKYFKYLLPAEMYALYEKTYTDWAHVWDSIFAACDLFRIAAPAVAERLGFEYVKADEEGMMAYLKMVREDSFA